MSFPVTGFPVENPPARDLPAEDVTADVDCREGDRLPASSPPIRLQLPKAKEDTPESWGDRADDLGDFLASERPPHW